MHNLKVLLLAIIVGLTIVPAVAVLLARAVWDLSTVLADWLTE